jgi:hypothetical protein
MREREGKKKKVAKVKTKEAIEFQDYLIFGVLFLKLVHMLVFVSQKLINILPLFSEKWSNSLSEKAKVRDSEKEKERERERKAKIES